jgi:hypothetical protein
MFGEGRVRRSEREKLKTLDLFNAGRFDNWFLARSARKFVAIAAISFGTIGVES